MFIINHFLFHVMLVRVAYVDSQLMLSVCLSVRLSDQNVVNIGSLCSIDIIIAGLASKLHAFCLGQM